MTEGFEGLPDRTRDECGAEKEPLPPVFVFGSNAAGRHGKGAALWARRNRGAVYGRGAGPQGNSYAIPTKGFLMETLPLHEIACHVHDFKDYARAHPERRFQLTPIGCGLAGYEHRQVAPLFADAPANVILPVEFVDALAGPVDIASRHQESR